MIAYKETVRSILEKRGPLNLAEIEVAEALQKIADRVLKKLGVIPFSDFDSFVEELHQWERAR